MTTPANKNKLWTEDEEKFLYELRSNGESFCDIARNLGRTPQAVKGKWKQLKRMRERESRHVKGTICWGCKNSLVNCKKPVEGFVARVKEYEHYDPPRYSYMVKYCPNFDPEPYAPQNGGRIK